jgi:predicted amidohydrolase YtcJ
VVATEVVPVETAIETHSSGSLVVGAHANLTVLQENILKIAPDRIAETKAEMSVVDGEIRYVAATFDQGFSTTLQ